MKMVVIDDEGAIAQLVARFAARLGHSCTAFRDARIALEHLASDVDLVISDVVMPGLDGFAVAREVAAQLGTCPPKTLLISGYVHEIPSPEFSPRTVLGILPKPFDLPRLRAVLNLLEETRERCPGKCRALWTNAGSPCRYVAQLDEGQSRICHGSRYAACAHYESGPGHALQVWMAESPEVGGGGVPGVAERRPTALRVPVRSRQALGEAAVKKPAAVGG